MAVSRFARRSIRVRRRARTAITAAGVVNLVSAVTPPLAARLRVLDGVVPLNAREGAAATAALLGVLLVTVAPGLRRGQRRAWSTAMVLLAVAVLSNVVKGLDVEEAAASVVLAIYLARHRRSFVAGTDDVRTRRTIRGVGYAASAASLVTAAWLAVAVSRDHALAPGPIFNRFTGSHRWAVTAFVISLGAAIGVLAWGLLRPARATPTSAVDLARARSIVARGDSSTLDYFALRDDKLYWFDGECVVAYIVLNGVCLVSPDPVGPSPDRSAVWLQFRDFAHQRGWTVVVLGATESWRGVYQAAGMRSIYLGDEAVVDVASFSLDGGRFKGLRQAVNRVQRCGYTAEIVDPAALDSVTRSALRQLMTESRRGDAERGFSMTLGRLFSLEDSGLLLTVVRDASGSPVAFCQFVPAPAIGGYSLDVMRRSTGEHPNGLIDFVVVATIRHLAATGARGLSLNFAAMRAVLADEDCTTIARRSQRVVLKRLSRSFQIESLWRFNAKFDPIWMPRYLLVESVDQLARAGLASLRAEGVFEDLWARPSRAEPVATTRVC